MKVIRVRIARVRSDPWRLQAATVGGDCGGGFVADIAGERFAGGSGVQKAAVWKGFKAADKWSVASFELSPASSVGSISIQAL